MQKIPQKNEISDESWDIKKILIALLVIVPILFLAFSYRDIIFGQKAEPPKNQSVKGLSASNHDSSSVDSSSLPSTERLGVETQQRLESAKQQIQNLNVAEIATSSPQVQKIINDIKALPNYPASQAKGLCLKLCDGL